MRSVRAGRESATAPVSPGRADPACPAHVPRLRRLVAAIVGVLLLQLTLQESAWACVWTSAVVTAAAERSHAAHGTMAHEHGVATRQGALDRAVAGDAVSATAPTDGRTGDPPCCAPDAMHSGCATAGAVTVATVVAGVGATTEHAPVRWPRVADVPTSPGAAPDVPPPKA